MRFQVGPGKAFQQFYMDFCIKIVKKKKEWVNAVFLSP